jgi:hypothetical protein
MADDEEQEQEEFGLAPEFDLPEPPEAKEGPPTQEELRQAYLDYIEQFPGYQTILNQTRQDYTPKGWIRNPVKLPRFSNEEFEQLKADYQAKYGSKIVIPKFEDTIHWNTPPTITAEEYAAHKYAQARGMPSPLDDEQLAYLAYKKQMFLGMLQSPEPAIARDAGAIITALDAAQQALIAATVIAKLAIKVAPELLKGLEGPAGWLLLGADILNLGDLYSQIGTAGKSKKRGIEALQEKNPFSKQSYANRASRISREWPTIGEFIQIAHTADHMFGVGLSLGAIVGFQTQVVEAGMDQIAQFGANVAATIAYPSAAETIWADALSTLGALWASKDVALTAGPETLLLMGSQALSAITPKWIKDDALERWKGLNQMEVEYPSPKYEPTIDDFKEFGIDPLAQLAWPLMDQDSASIDDLNDTYPGLITDNIQAWLLSNHDNDEGLIASHQVSDFIDQAIAMFSDDGQAANQQDAYTQSMKNMALANLYWATDTPQDLLQQLADWIGKYERDTGSAPSAKEIKLQGMLIGIKFPFTPPSGLGPRVKDLFPGWNAIQDQLGKYKIDP